MPIEKNNEKKLRKREKNKKVVRKKIEIDFWKTDLHGKEIGVRQKDQLRAKSRHFSKDMDLFGAVEIDGEKAGTVGYRTSPWKRGSLSDGELRRLIIRYFSESDRWIASVEENTIESLLRSVGKEEPLPVFNIFQQGVTKIFPLERIEKEWGQMGKYIVPLLLNNDTEEVEFFVFSERRLTIGRDWKIYRPNNPKIIAAEIDEKKFNIGGKLEVKIYDPDLAGNKIFINTLILFGALLKFLSEVVEDLKFSDISYRNGNFSFQPNKFELELLENPRRYSR